MSTTKVETKSLQRVVGKRIRMVREYLKMSRSDFMERCGYTNNHLERIERGIHPPKPELLQRLCDLYDINPAWLLDESEDSDNPMFVREKGTVLSAGERVKNYRLEIGLMQKEFAKEAGISTTNLMLVETGQRELSKKMAKAIESKFFVGANWLLYGREESKNYPLTMGLLDYLSTHEDARKKVWEQYQADNPHTSC